MHINQFNTKEHAIDQQVPISKTKKSKRHKKSLSQKLAKNVNNKLDNYRLKRKCLDESFF